VLLATVVLAHRIVAALGCAAVTTVLAYWYCFPPTDCATAGQVLERLLLMGASLLTGVLAHIVMGNE
jgi:hypothetical protein